MSRRGNPTINSHRLFFFTIHKHIEYRYFLNDNCALYIQTDLVVITHRKPRGRLSILVRGTTLALSEFPLSDGPTTT